MKQQLALVAALALGAGSAYAAGGSDQFSQMDADQSKSLTQSEFLQGGLYQTLDKDSDGQLSEDEWNGQSEQFSQYDQDGNGQLSEDEFLGGTFAQADQDGNGELSQQEFQSAFIDTGSSQRASADMGQGEQTASDSDSE